MSGKLKEVRERISSVQSTQQITKAMKMVSAAKLRRAQDAIVQMRPYADKLNKMLVNILSNLEAGASTVYNEARESENVLIVVVTSNRGLCGAFNSNIIKAAESRIENQYARQKESGKLNLLCIGKKGYEHFEKLNKKGANIPLIKDYVALFEDLGFDNVALLAKKLISRFEKGNYDVIEVAYGQFKNAAVQLPLVEKLLPVESNKTDSESPNMHRAEYIFEPDTHGLLETLIPSILQTTFYKFLLDTHASEHGARMTAMDKATENADELMKDLKITYNKARQEAITSELSEIVGGAAALEG